MSAYIRQLQAEVNIEKAKRAEERAATAEEARERLSPLEGRLMRVLASMPKELQLEGLSLTELQQSLRGRSRGNCHPGELGASLRKLGFVRRRRWRDGQGFRALWYPFGDRADKQWVLTADETMTGAKYGAAGTNKLPHKKTAA